MLAHIVPAPGAALAAPRVEWISRYEAPPECPTREAAEARLAAHLEEAGTVRSVLVRLSIAGGEGKAFRGALDTIDAEGERTHRELSDPTCTEVVWSLAFIAALAISPDAKVIAPPPPPPPPRAPPAPLVVAPAPRETPIPPPAGARSSVEAGVLARLGVLPGLAIGAEMRGAYRSFALALGFATAGSVAAAEGDASFRIVAARADVCPFARERRVRLEGCAGLEGGVLLASSGGIAAAREAVALGSRRSWRFVRTSRSRVPSSPRSKPAAKFRCIGRASSRAHPRPAFTRSAPSPDRSRSPRASSGDDPEGDRRA